MGAASAVKVFFAAWTKGSAALLLAIRGLARAEGIDDALLSEWAISIPDLAERSELSAFGNAPKAWRFVGEMEQIASAFDEHDLPAGFAAAAADLYRRLTMFKDAPGPTLDLVVDAIVRNDQGRVDLPGIERGHLRGGLRDLEHHLAVDPDRRSLAQPVRPAHARKLSTQSENSRRIVLSSASRNALGGHRTAGSRMAIRTAR